MTEVRVQKQYAYALVESDHLRVRKQYAYAMLQQDSDADLTQLSKQVLFQPDSESDITQLFKQVLYRITPPRPYKLSGVTTMFGNLGSVLNPIDGFRTVGTIDELATDGYRLLSGDMQTGGSRRGLKKENNDE